MNLSIEFLESKRKRTDEFADELVQRLFDEGHGHGVLSLFKELDNNSVRAPEGLPDYITSYFNETVYPDWVNWDKIKIGQQVFRQYGDAISMLLFFKALPLCYSCAHGAKVMYKTQRFMEQGKSFDSFVKRLVETAQYVVNVLSVDGFEPEGKGLVTAKKVRLIHAAIRYYIRKGEWDSKVSGEPINQEDLAGTLMSFSSLMLEGLEQIDIELSDEEKDGYIHVWKLAGHLNGLDEDLLPNSAKEAEELGNVIFEHQTAYSLEGKQLIESLINYIEYMIPGNRFDNLALVFINYFMGDKYYEMMHLPQSKEHLERFVEKVLSTYFDKKQNLMKSSKVIKPVFEMMNKVFLQGLLNYFNKFDDVNFYLPKSLQQDWNVVGWEDVISSPSALGFRLSLQKKD